MLILDGDATVGLLSGGCLEGDLAERARSVLASGRPATVTYDMSSQDDLLWGLGLGCAGQVQVLLERVPGGEADGHLEFLDDLVERQRPGVLATLFGSDDPARFRPGSRLTAPDDGPVAGSLGDAELDRGVLEAGRTLRAGGAGHRVCEHAVAGVPVEVLVEALEPPVPLVLFGAGADAVPLAELAHDLGWHVTVVDHRPALARPERFPAADEVVLAEPADVPREVALTERSVAVVMTHKFLHDVELLKILVPSPVRYLGLLGPRARGEQLLERLAREGVRPDPDRLRRIHGPVGLDIGAETPTEIALSVLAEIQARIAGRAGGPLRERRGPLHGSVG